MLNDIWNKHLPKLSKDFRALGLEKNYPGVCTKSIMALTVLSNEIVPQLWYEFSWGNLVGLPQGRSREPRRGSLRLSCLFSLWRIVRGRGSGCKVVVKQMESLWALLVGSVWSTEGWNGPRPNLSLFLTHWVNWLGHSMACFLCIFLCLLSLCTLFVTVISAHFLPSFFQQSDIYLI